MYLWTALFSFGVVALSAAKSPLVVLAAASVVAIAALVRDGLPAAAAAREAAPYGEDPFGRASSAGRLTCGLYRYLAGNSNL